MRAPFRAADVPVNRLQANLCLLCVTLCWSAEVVLYACIPKGVPAFANTTAFPILLGIPLAILLQEEFGLAPAR